MEEFDLMWLMPYEIKALKILQLWNMDHTYHLQSSFGHKLADLIHIARKFFHVSSIQTGV
jgi:hypothetical protein